MSYSPNGEYPDGSRQVCWEDGERVFCRGWLQPAISVARRYGLALVSVSVAFVLAQAFLYYGLPLPFTAFALSAIASTFWYGGTKPGILSALISWLVRDYFFEPEVSPESRILYGLAFLVFAFVMTLVMRGRNELEARVAERTAELTKSNEDLTREIVLVAVRDSGPGIDPEHRERVFQAFYTTKSSGVGMGLSICRSIVDAHGGRLWADANEPRGAVFQFALPGAEEAHESSSGDLPEGRAA